MIVVSIKSQQLRFQSESHAPEIFAVSTGENGVGSEAGSQKTPLGLHRISCMIGKGLPNKAVFRGRRWTGEVFSSELGYLYPKRDWILSRLLWLDGVEPGRNRGGKVDTQRRYIYIHGTDEEEQLGLPCSHGCVRMGNNDVIRLFQLVRLGDLVSIEP